MSDNPKEMGLSMHKGMFNLTNLLSRFSTNWGKQGGNQSFTDWFYDIFAFQDQKVATQFQQVLLEGM